MRIGLLGPLEVIDDDGAPVELPGGKPRTLLAVLACHAGRPVSAEVLVESLWGSAPPARADANVRVYVHHLRKALGGDRIGRRPEGYVLWLEPGELDAARFRSLLATARAEPLPERALESLEAALALWRGPALAGLESVPALAADATGLEELRLQALEQRFEIELSRGRHEGTIAELRALTGQYPLRETFRAQLMRALVGVGRGAEAAAVFESARQVLADELGLDPSPQLRDLHLAVLRNDAPPPAAEPAPFAAVVPRQLPSRVAGFAGRTEWLARMDELLPADDAERDVQVVTISGAGGIGKTTLAVHWAHSVSERFPDGQLYLNLHGFDPVRTPVDPPAALSLLLTALGVRPRDIPPDPAQRESLYRSVVAARRVLVVLDNAHDAAQVRPLLPGGTGCLAVVTSRDPLTGLAAAGARPMMLDLFDTIEAADLLERRLGRWRVAADPAAVADVIARCGGLPLALSVVAARAAVTSTPSLAALAGELGRARRALDSFAGVDAATDPRAVFSWSYRVLDDATARMFRLLSVHPGPEVTVGAAASLAGVPPEAAGEALRRLCAASLLNEAGPGRFAAHDLIRAYAVELAESTDADAERDAALSRLLDHLVHSAYPATLLLDPNQTPTPIDPAAPAVTPDVVADRQQAMAWFDAERAVLLAAVERARADHPSHAWQLACACVVYLERTGRWPDKLAVLGAALESVRRTGDRPVEARILRSLGRTLGRLHQHDEATEHLREAVSLYRDLGDANGLAHATGTLGELLEGAGRYEEAMTYTRLACDLYRRNGNTLGEARSLGGVATLQTMTGRYVEAIATCERALELFTAAGVQGELAQAGVYDTLGVANHHLGAHAKAIECFDRSLAGLSAGARFYAGLVLTHRADTRRAAGDRERARQDYREALTIFTGLGAREAETVRNQLAALSAELTPRSS
ncbi:tetratricopeptide repeat protein [Dactylosporangium vinaceum]|uniref:BTAD domain-containing putative transcriptional regulator n=1 Tax=Dactylosporangium vinaceum TaxID=53362 RepID=A0ABV5ML60_9ACTN|nr:BTAD domain-containing putative transcriptional regulator [Dactylosporangium vinaceum]UAB94118.1 tetratricopeptide repeat protein [Dactylosporangium vinaceum]